MNVLAQLEQELKNKNWTKEEKRRYIYLRSCEIFSYDPRYFLCSELINGKEIQKKIRDQKIDLENVDTPWSVCTSHAKEVLIPLYREFLNEEYETPETFDHAEISLEDDKHGKMRIDPTRGHDYTRVKMQQSTYGYSQWHGSSKSFIADLKQIDRNIGYLDQKYREEEIVMNVRQSKFNYWDSMSEEEKDEYSDDYLIYRMRETEKELAKYPNVTEVSDLKRCITYIQSEFLGRDFSVRTAKISLYNINPDFTWEFATLYPIELENDMLYYALAKEKDHYTYHEITKEDAICYTKNYEGRNKGLIYHH